MERHPREILISEAHKEFRRLYVDWYKQYNLTDAEIISILSDTTVIVSSRLVNDERYNDDGEIIL